MKGGYDPILIEDPAPFTVEISRYQKYGELLRTAPVMTWRGWVGKEGEVSM